MQGVYCTEPGKFEVKSLTLPPLSDDEVLLKVSYCGICGSDHHIIGGHFPVKWPLVPGHEVVGSIAEVGKSVEGFSVGDRCVVDPITSCYKCFFCLRGQFRQCASRDVLGVTQWGGFSTHVVVKSNKLHKFYNLTDEEATLVEPCSCAVNTVDQLALPVGSDALVIGAGPSGIMISQLLKLNGASRVVLTSNKGVKMNVAKEVGAADVYLELDRDGGQTEEQWKKFKGDNPLGFDAVVDATGNVKVLNDALDLVRPGGALAVYSIYGKGKVEWDPNVIFLREIRIIGTFGQSNTFPRAVAYLDSGKINVKGMISRVYGHSEFSKALESLDNKECMKIAVRPDVA